MKFSGVSLLYTTRLDKYFGNCLCINLPLQNEIYSSKKFQQVSVKGTLVVDSTYESSLLIYSKNYITVFRCVASTPAIRNTIF